VTLLRGRALPVVLAGLIALVLVLWVANGAWAAFLDQLRGDDGALLASLGETVERVASTAATFAALALLGLTPIVVLLGVLRALARRRRRYARLAIVPSQNEATPERVQELATAIHQRVEERWYRRLLTGQPSATLGVRSAPDGDGPCQMRIEVVCPEQMAATVEGAVRAPYPDARVEQGAEVAETPACLLKLHKRHSFIRRLRTPERYDPPPMDAILTQLAKLTAPASVQYVLTPVPALFDWYARRRFQSEELRLARKQRGPVGHPGLQSELAERELEGGLALQHNRLFFAEIRVGAQSSGEARDLASAIQARTAAENQLVERHLLAFRGRVGEAVGDIVPDIRRGVISSAEVAGLWQLPSPGLTGVSLARSATPRALAAPEMSRDPAHAVVRDEHGPVGLRPEERFAGVAITGAQGTGKSSVELRFVHNDTRCDKAVVVLDPKSDLADEALGVIPSDRVVHHLDPLEPEFGFNPLLAPGHPATIADNMVGAVKDLYEEGDLHASSERFIYEATMAIVGAHRLGVLGWTPTFWDVSRMLHLEQEDFWAKIARAIESEQAYFETSTYFGKTLPAQLQAARSAFAQRLEAPSNKLQALLSGHLDRVFRHPRVLSLDRVVRDREVLVVNGRMGDFGARNTRMLMQVILNSLYGALRRQQELPESERAKAVLVVDEAHLVLNPRFAEALATLRSAGLEVVAAWQYGEQIQDPLIRAGLMNLLGNRFVFRTSEIEEARELSGLMAATYSDRMSADPDTRERVRFPPDTLFALGDYRTAATLIARGGRRATFVGETYRMHSDPTLRAHHLAAQRERGGFVPEDLEHPWKGGDEGGAEPRARAPSARGNGAQAALDGDEPVPWEERSGGGDGAAAGVANEEVWPVETETHELASSAPGPIRASAAETQPIADDRASESNSPDRDSLVVGRPRTYRMRTPSPSALEILEENRRLYSGGDTGPTPSRRSPDGRDGDTKPKRLLYGEEGQRRGREREREEGEAHEPEERKRSAREQGSHKRERAEEAPKGAEAESELEELRRRVAELEGEIAAQSEGSPQQPEGVEGDGASASLDEGGRAGGKDARTRARARKPGKREARPAPAGSLDAAAVPESYTELAIDDPSGLEWDSSANQPKRIEPERAHLKALATLHRLRLAYGSQLRRLCWPDVGDTTNKKLLRELFAAGWVDRGYIKEKGAGGRPQRFYALSEAGFTRARAHEGPRGPYIPEGAKWTATRLEASKTAIHDLHVVGWLVSFHALAGRLVGDWYGEQHGVRAPERRVDGRWKQIEVDAVDRELGRDVRGVRDLKLERFAPVKPDLTIELRKPERLDVLVELDTSKDPSTDHNVKKLRRYDALPIWAPHHPRYRGHAELPIAVFVMEDEPTLRKFLDRADSEMTGAISRTGTQRETWAYPGRERTYFCCERDVHMGSLRAWQLPGLPPEVRKAAGERRGVRVGMDARQVELLDQT